MIFCVHTQEGTGLVERHERLFEEKTYSPSEDMYENASLASLIRSALEIVLSSKTTIMRR